MNNLLSLLRNVTADLVEKKLWPVAVALLVLLAAVPFVIAGGGESVDDADIPVAAVPEAGEDAGVTLAEDAARGPGVSTRRNDPFAKREAPKPPAATTTGASDATTSGGSGAGSGSTGGATPGLKGADVVPVGGSSEKPASTDARDTWHVDLRFGKDGSLAARNDVTRLSPLPSADDPFFVFLGVAADGKTALFLVSSDAEVTGDGKCVPSKTDCERVEMQAGDTQFFDVTVAEGEVVQYQLDLVRIQRQRQASASAASTARSRESSEGREVLRSAVASKQVDVSDLAYSRELGLVVPTGVGQESPSALFGGYRVDLRFGAPGSVVKRYNLARLTPLPSVESPSLVFLGVLDDRKTVLFLNPSEAAASGDAACEPSPEECQRIKLQDGQSATLVAPGIDGSTTAYELHVDGVTPLQATTTGDARASRHRESPAGREILRRLINEVGTLVGDLTFSGKLGVLQSTPPAPAGQDVQAAPGASTPAE